MNIRDLRYVVAVAEEEHFGRAAIKCHVSQPALSGQIRKLEEFLGVTLFERTNRSVQTTPVGLRIVGQARQLILISDEIVDTAQSAKSPYSGQFRLGMIATIGPYLSPLILATIQEQLPELQLTLIESLTTDLEKRVASGDLDGAIIATVPVDHHLTSVPLYEEPFWIAVSNSHPLTQQETINIEELPHEELLLLADGHCLRDQVLDVCHLSTGTTTANTLETSMETLLSLVASGNGVTLAPALIVASAHGERRGVAIRRDASGRAKRDVRLVSRTSFPRTVLIERLASIIQASVPTDMVKIL